MFVFVLCHKTPWKTLRARLTAVKARLNAAFGAGRR